MTKPPGVGTPAEPPEAGRCRKSPRQPVTAETLETRPAAAAATAAPPAALGAQADPDAELVERADVITVHVPRTKETAGMPGREAFRKVKPGVLVVNAARGGIIDEAALLEALDDGRVATRTRHEPIIAA